MDKVPGTHNKPDDDMPDTLPELQEACNQELKMWQVAGMAPPAAVTHNVWDMDVRISVTLQVLKDAFGMTDEELTVMFMQKQLLKLRKIRGDFTRAKIMQGVSEDNGEAPPQIKRPWEKG